MTQLAAGFATKDLLNLETSSPVATGLAHEYSSFDFIKFSLGERCSVVYINQALSYKRLYVRSNLKGQVQSIIKGSIYIGSYYPRK